MTRRGMMVFVLLSVVFSLFWAVEVIHFECPNLEERIRRAEGYTGAETGPIYPEDVLWIVQLYERGIYARGFEITSLMGIQPHPGSQNMKDINTLIGRLIFVSYEPQN